MLLGQASSATGDFSCRVLGQVLGLRASGTGGGCLLRSFPHLPPLSLQPAHPLLSPLVSKQIRGNYVRLVFGQWSWSCGSIFRGVLFKWSVGFYPGDLPSLSYRSNKLVDKLGQVIRCQQPLDFQFTQLIYKRMVYFPMRTRNEGARFAMLCAPLRFDSEKHIGFRVRLATVLSEQKHTHAQGSGAAFE